MSARRMVHAAPGARKVSSLRVFIDNQCSGRGAGEEVRVNRRAFLFAHVEEVAEHVRELEALVGQLHGLPAHFPGKLAVLEDLYSMERDLK